MKFNKLKDIFLNNDSFMLTTHVNPDADAIGSEIAVYNILKELNKKVFIINHSEIPYNLKFLDSEQIIQQFDENKHPELFNKADVLLALDFNRSDRMVSMQKYFVNADKTKICIDHHQDPEDFVDYKFVDDSFSSTGEIIYEFIKQSQIVPLNQEMAIPIYAAIMTDTGSFRFERTTAKLHKIAADLLEHGVNPTEIYDRIFDQSKISKIKLLGRTLDTLTLISNDEIGYMQITQDTFKELKALESDTDGFVNYPLSIENVVISLLFIELADGFKVSFRSKGTIAVNELAAKIGGGGHTNAAGARLRNRRMNEEMPKILSMTQEFLNNNLKE